MTSLNIVAMDELIRKELNRLSKMVVDRDEIAMMMGLRGIGDQLDLVLDALPPAVETIYLPSGISKELRHDGTVRVQAYDEFIERMRKSADPVEHRWAKQAKTWHYIGECLDHPMMHGEDTGFGFLTEEQVHDRRIKILKNFGESWKLGNWWDPGWHSEYEGDPRAELGKRAGAWVAKEVFVGTKNDGVLGEPIKDAQTFRPDVLNDDDEVVVAGAVAAEFEAIAEIHLAVFRRSQPSR